MDSHPAEQGLGRPEAQGIAPQQLRPTALGALDILAISPPDNPVREHRRVKTASG
jgi:hypothetical protein